MLIIVLQAIPCKLAGLEQYEDEPTVLQELQKTMNVEGLIAEVEERCCIFVTRTSSFAMFSAVVYLAVTLLRKSIKLCGAVHQCRTLCRHHSNTTCMLRCCRCVLQLCCAHATVMLRTALSMWYVILVNLPLGLFIKF